MKNTLTWKEWSDLLQMTAITEFACTEAEALRIAELCEGDYSEGKTPDAALLDFDWDEFMVVAHFRNFRHFYTNEQL